MTDKLSVFDSGIVLWGQPSELTPGDVAPNDGSFNFLTAEEPDLDVDWAQWFADSLGHGGIAITTYNSWLLALAAAFHARSEFNSRLASGDPMLEEAVKENGLTTACDEFIRERLTRVKESVILVFEAVFDVGKLDEGVASPEADFIAAVQKNSQVAWDHLSELIGADEVEFLRIPVFWAKQVAGSTSRLLQRHPAIWALIGRRGTGTQMLKLVRDTLGNRSPEDVVDHIFNEIMVLGVGGAA